MRVAEFSDGVRIWNRQNPGALLEEIPAGSGLCRIVNVDFADYDPMYLSKRPGRWTNGLEVFRYFADDLHICAAELGYFVDPVPPDRVVELWHTTRIVQAVSISRLPALLKEALYEDRGIPAVKWEKPHIFLDELRACPEYRNIQFIYAPSASGELLNFGGTCFVAPNSNAVERIRSMRYEDWRDL